MAGPLNLVSRRVANLLSSARLYRDSLPQHAKQLLGARHPAIQPLKDLRHDHPTQPMPYRLMEAIRNYSQLLRHLLARYAEKAKIPQRDLIGVAVGFESPDRTISGAEYLVEHRLDYFKYLRVKHLTAASMSRCYVPW